MHNTKFHKQLSDISSTPKYDHASSFAYDLRIFFVYLFQDSCEYMQASMSYSCLSKLGFILLERIDVWWLYRLQYE